MSKSRLQESAGDELVLESSPASCYQLRVSRLDVFDLSLCRTLSPWLYSRSRARVLQSPSGLRCRLANSGVLLADPQGLPLQLVVQGLSSSSESFSQSGLLARLPRAE